MPNPDIAWYFCCLNPAERSVMRVLAEATVLTVGAGLPVALWDAIWGVQYLGGQARRDAFLHLYGLEIVTITPAEGGVPFSVVHPIDLDFWLAAAVFVFTPAAACLDGCTQSIRPTPH